MTTHGSPKESPWRPETVLDSVFGVEAVRGSLAIGAGHIHQRRSLSHLNTDFRNQRGGFMNGWTSQTDRAFYQMQYLTGHETDEMKMVIGNSHLSTAIPLESCSGINLGPIITGSWIPVI